MIIALGREWSLLVICTVIQLLEASINRRLMSVLRVRVSFDVMSLFRGTQRQFSEKYLFGRRFEI